MMQELRHWDALLFNENSIELVRTFSSWGRGLMNFLLGMLLLALPLTYDEVFTTLDSFVRYVIIYSALIILLFLLSRVFGSDMKLVKFWYTISTLIFFAAVPLAILTYFCLFVLEALLDNVTVPNMIVSLVPYYLFLLMAFGSEQSARIPSEKKSIAFGVCSVVLVYTFMYFL